MKIIHCADLHIDSKMETLPSDKTRIRREEVLHAFERLTEYAVANAVAAVIIAGDMFDTVKISAKTKNRVIHAIERAPEVDFLYLTGNHDEDGFLNSIENMPENLKIFGSDWTYFQYGDVCIAGIIQTEKNAGLMYDTLKLQENNKNIVVLHGQTADYKSNDQAALISIPKLKNKNIDYLALGHIHSYSENILDDRGVFAYSGCLEGRGFDETGEKGFVIIDTSQVKLRPEFVRFSARQMFVYEFDLTDCKNWYAAQEEILDQLKNNYPPESLVKVILKGEIKPTCEADVNSLLQRLLEIFFYAKIYDRTVLSVGENDYKYDKSVRGEFMRAVQESDMDELTKRRVIMCGINALKGEDF